MSDVVIRVENLYKEYQLGTISHGTLSQDLQSKWARFRGKEDPNTKVDLINRTQFNSSNERFCALKDVTFDIQRGEIVGIIGRNGAGKSTLLKILSQVTAPTKGTVKIKGRVASLLEVGTGFHPELTGRENIFLNGAILGMHRWEIEQKFEEIVKFSEIEKFIDTPVKRYSNGMYVRLAFAVAAHLDPEILILDEVLAVGDVAFQKKCLGKMGSVAKEGRTVIFVSHNMGAISMLCLKAILIDAGKIVTEGITSEVIDSYNRFLQEQFDNKDAERTYDNDYRLPAQILWIQVINPEGRTTLKHDIYSSIHIDLEFVVRRFFSNLFIACSVFTNMGQVIFSTNEMDWANYSGHKPDKTFPKKPGHYKASFEFPAPLLHEGIYELRFTLSEPNIANIETQGGFFIEIMDSGSFMSLPFKREGLLAVPIQWQIEKYNG